ncbi:suppression of tumorigenicity 5 protein, partial [Asbolus verrucosus]
MSLQKTLERCLDKDTNDELDQKEKISVDMIINKFQTYVKTMPKYQKPKLHKDDRLFYCCLIVGWDTEKPQIKFKFPASVKIPNRIEDLCYPEAASGPLDISDNAQCYSLVITNDKGERTFGYCRRVIPEGSTKCIPLAYCILSKYRAPRFYKKILMELESRHGIPDKLRDELISEFYYNKFPRPGESIKINLTNIIGNLNAHKTRTSRQDSDNLEPIDLDLTSFVHVNASGYGTLNKVKKTSNYENVTVIDSDDSDDRNCSSAPSVIVENNGKTELILTLHHDTRYEEADLKPLHQLPPDILLKIFASLLLERKVILISCVISKLSCCVDALQSILYPFSWPHTFIPILPQCLWDVVESPTPVICGILSVSVVNDHKIEHGIVVDLDEGNILSEEGDENSILSSCMKKAWNQGLALANTVPPENYVHSVYLSDAYIKVFIASLKHYKNHISGGSFEKESFIRNAKTKGIRRFLKWFTETTMFISFIDSVLSNPDSFKLFDKKIEMYGSDESRFLLEPQYVGGIVVMSIDFQRMRRADVNCQVTRSDKGPSS